MVPSLFILVTHVQTPLDCAGVTRSREVDVVHAAEMDVGSSNGGVKEERSWTQRHQAQAQAQTQTPVDTTGRAPHLHNQTATL